MAALLYASHSLHVRALYQGVEPKVEPLLVGTSFLADRRALVKLAAGAAGEAFRDGVRFGKVLRKGRHDGAYPAVPNPVFPKAKLFTNFLADIRTAEQVFRIKNDARRRGLKRDRLDSQREIIFREYVNAVKRAMGKLLLDAAAAGVMEVV